MHDYKKQLATLRATLKELYELHRQELAGSDLELQIIWGINNAGPKFESPKKEASYLLYYIQLLFDE
jgi:hypothetical protein